MTVGEQWSKLDVRKFFGARGAREVPGTFGHPWDAWLHLGLTGTPTGALIRQNWDSGRPVGTGGHETEPTRNA
nr:hypothetical protein KPHV_48180 [Kitasatospora purpeofusca]